MDAHQYSIIRCHPNPSTGECVNLGVLAGNVSSGEWGLRLLNDQKRVARFAGAQALGASLGVVAQLAEQLSSNSDALDEGGEPTIGPDWLSGLAADYNNLIQFSEPASVMAESLDEALNRVFHFRLEEPLARESRIDWLSRNSLKAAQREALSDLPAELVHEGAELFVGASVSSRMDFAVANGHALLLSHGWSFLVGDVEKVGTKVKAWAYAVERLRNSEPARLMVPNQETSAIEPDVRLAVLVSDASTSAQHAVRDESLQVLAEIDANVFAYGDEGKVHDLAASVLAAR